LQQVKNEPEIDFGTTLKIMKSLPTWKDAVEKIRTKVKSPENQAQVHKIKNTYLLARGPMVVDVVASRRRRYETHVEGRIIPVYKTNAKDLSLRTLASDGPVGVTLWAGEALTMKNLAHFLLSFAQDNDDELTVTNFATQSGDPSVRAKAISIKGIGPVLYEYLRLLSGVDTLKADSRVRLAIGALGIPESLFSDEGILEICRALATECGCTLVQLDQALWNKQY